MARTNSVERELYGDEPLPGDHEMFTPATALREPLRQRQGALRDAGFSSDELKAWNRDYVTLAHTTGLPPAVLAEIHGFDARVSVDGLRKPADPAAEAAQNQAWFEASRHAARLRYGQAAEGYLQRVDAFLAAHPTLAKQLDTIGHRHHPTVVEHLLEHVRTRG